VADYEIVGWIAFSLTPPKETTMRKLKLKIEELTVEQFQLVPDVATTQRGTVPGLQLSLGGCISSPCGTTDYGGDDTHGCASFANSGPCVNCVEEPIRPA
jgi:hypothetical protein